MEPVSRKSTCKVGPGRFIPQYRRKKDWTSNGKHIEQHQRPQLLCVLLVQRIYAIDLALIPLLGNVAEIQKISYETPRSIYGETSNE